MDLLYVQEHLTCYNYDGGGRPAVEAVNVPPGEPLVMEVIEPEIMIVLRGCLSISFEDIENGIMNSGEMVMLPPCSKVCISTEKPADILTFRLRTSIQLCDRYSLEKLYEEAGQDTQPLEGRLNTLKANERVDSFVEHFVACVNDGLRCIYFFEIKIKELFFMLRAYYPKKELAAFLSPLLSANSNFLYFVLENFDKVRSVKEFAQVAGYSLSGFDKQFRKVFGMSAFQWMKQKRLKSIYHEINCSPKTFREICEDQGFSSLSQFNDYCKKNFGLTPGRIRRKVDPVPLTATK